MKRVYGIDDGTGTDFWRKSIAKEMLKVKVAYVEKEETPEQILSGEVKGCIGPQEVTCHLIFDVRMNFSIKARMVANGAMTGAPSSLTYSSVVSKNSDFWPS